MLAKAFTIVSAYNLLSECLPGNRYVGWPTSVFGSHIICQMNVMPHATAFLNRTQSAGLRALLGLVLSLLLQQAFAQSTLLDYRFNSAPLPEGITTDGTLSTSGSINNCTVCSQGRLVLGLGRFVEFDLASTSLFRVTLKSSGSGARTVTVRYKLGGQAGFTTAGTVSAPQAGGWFELTTLFPELISTQPMVIRLENAPSGGEVHLHDVLAMSHGGAATAAEILAFKLPGQIGGELINPATGQITLQVAPGLSLTSIVPAVVQLSAGATLSPSATEPRNFSGGVPVPYTVTAQDGTTTRAWQVTVLAPPEGFIAYEAEDALFTGTVDNNHSGFTGAGFVNFLASGENEIIFTICQAEAGTRQARFVYALEPAEARPGQLYVNDVWVGTLPFASTGAWTGWQQQSIMLTLPQGISSLKITWEETDGPNLDKLLLEGEPCTTFPLTVAATQGGSVILSPARPGNVYFAGEVVSLLANATPALRFTGWQGDLSGTQNPAQLVMNAAKMVTAGFEEVPVFALNVAVTGVGKVTRTPMASQYAEGTVVTLSAETVLGSSFLGWSGQASGTSNTIQVTMDANKSITAAFSNTASIDFEKPVGFATTHTGTLYPNFNSQVTGGQGATDTLWVRGPADFDSLAWKLLYRNRAYRTGNPQNGMRRAPLVIVFKEGVYPAGVSGSSAWGNGMLTVQEQADLTIMGEKNVVLNFGLNIKRSWNILIRNLHFQDYPDDGINIGEPETHHIWVDHCTVGHPTTRPSNPNSPDGGIDIKGGASYVTVSWCLIRNSWKTSLVGHSDNNGAEDEGKLKVTFFANHFVNTNSRNPRVRFGEVHVLNNLNERIELYGIAAANAARVVAEGNFYLNTRWAMYADRTLADFRAVFGNNTDNVFTSKTGNRPALYLKQVNNAYDDSELPVITAQINPAMLNPGGRSVRFDELNPHLAFDPASYYTYTAFDPEVVRTIVPLFAGADKVDFFTPPPSILPPGTAAVVAKDGTGNFTTLQAAVDAAPMALDTPYVIFIKNGHYNEEVVVPATKPFISLIGQSADGVVVYHNLPGSGGLQAGSEPAAGGPAVFTVQAPHFSATNITFANTAGGQSVAVAVLAQGAVFQNCRVQCQVEAPL